MRLSHRISSLLLAVGLVLTSIPAMAQGTQGATAGAWTIGVEPLKSRHTYAVSSTVVANSQSTVSRIYNSAGTHIGFYQDSLYVLRNPAAGQMFTDTLSSFSVAALQDWIPIRAGTITGAESDSVWMFSLHVVPVMDAATVSLAAPTTAGGVTVTADSCHYYLEASWDGGFTWNRTLVQPAPIVETGTSNSFHTSFLSDPPYAEAAFSPNAVLQHDPPLFRFILVHDMAGRYSTYLTYPKALR